MAYQSIQGGALLDALSKLLFKGIDNIFNTAVEYQKEMGVLKQINKIPVLDRLSNQEYELIVKLAPVKDKDGVYYVEIECPGYKKFKPGALHTNTIKLNNANDKEFTKLINKIIDSNNLERIVTEDEGSDADKESSNKSHTKTNDYVDTYTFLFHKYDEDKTDCTVTAELSKSTDGSEISLVVTGDPELAAKFVRKIDVEDPSSNQSDIGDALDNHLKQRCKLFVDESYKDEWLDFVDYLNNIEESTSAKEDKSEEEQPATASINVTLERIVGSDDHEDINLVSINSSSYPYRKALQIVETIVASDEFVDSMPEGVSTYNIIEEDDDYDISPC